MNSSEKKRYDYLFKIFSVGKSEIGKSKYLQTALGIDQEKKPIGVEHYVHYFDIATPDPEKTTILAQIWDFSGKKRFQCLSSKFVMGSSTNLVFYDLMDVTSIDIAKDYVDFIDTKLGIDPRKPIMLVGIYDNGKNEQVIELADNLFEQIQENREYAEHFQVSTNKDQQKILHLSGPSEIVHSDLPYDAPIRACAEAAYFDKISAEV
ncbi:MAG: hypothetical protein GOU99_02290 [Candidatus Altiarchaeota archaeon]|nr:hypothetical protein [Candidatus Altiarchaeota archaeon]